MIDSSFILHLRGLGVVLRAEGDRLVCNAPAGVLTPELVSQIRDNKDDVLRTLIEMECARSESELSLVKVEGEGEEQSPLTFAQQRLWFLDQLQPGTSVYNMSWALQLTGNLDVKALENSLNEIITRHNTLRSTFRFVDGAPVQHISPSLTIELAIVDLPANPRSSSDQGLDGYLNREAKKPFDLSQGPLIRALLIRQGEQEHVLFLVIHHIVFDGWSLDIFLRELFTLYKAIHNGAPPELPQLPLQYSDFSHWQRKSLNEEKSAKLLKYWRNNLEGMYGKPGLPLDYPRASIQTFNGSQEIASISEELAQSLRDLAREENASLFMVLLAVFKCLISRHIGHEDVCVGSPFSGRHRKEIESLIGFFVNTVVLRTDLSGGPSFNEALSRVRRVVLDAQLHQDIPFERVVEELAPPRDLGRTPLFQIFFNHIATQLKREPGYLDIDVALYPAYQGEIDAKFDLTFYVEEYGADLRFRIVYNRDLFDAERIAAMLEQYQSLLKQVVVNPEERISGYSLLTPIQENNLPDPASPIEQVWTDAVHQRFSKQALLAPERTAVVDAWGSWQYGELDRASNQLASHLRANGIQTGDVVAIYAHHSAGLVLALLGILKAGAAFLILDSNYPASRLITMLEEASPRGWLRMDAAGSVADELGALFEVPRFICRLQIPRSKEAIEDLLCGVSPEPLGDMVAPEDTAYITFTSGTTGRPKGILGTHRPLSHFMQWHCRQFGLNEADRFSMLSGLSHDPLLRDIFAPLWAGATLCIPDPDKILIPDKLRSWMGAQEITVAHMTPALGQLLTEGAGGGERGKERLSALRHVFFGGDDLTRGTVERICELAPDVTCVNFYGATETPQAMGYHVVNIQDDLLRERIPLGRGIEGVQLLVLTAARKLAGVGELGEIYVRTPYLTKGYLHDEALTRERYIANPFTNASGDRLYKTGDLGRYLPDGDIIFCGRGDSQVSIRGFRVEPKEIEAILGRHPHISNCAVIARAGESGNCYLTAYVVGNNAQNVNPVQYREYIGKHLPEYMIPSFFVQLDELPLTPNGKINVPRLISLGQSQIARVPMTEAPLTEMEETLMAIWKEALALDHISIHDNFFEIGGHSLLSIQVISQLEEKIGLRINPREFIYQTLGQLAASVELQRKDFTMGGEQFKKDSIWRRIKKTISAGNHRD